VAEVLTTVDEWTANEKKSKVTHVVDASGNVTVQRTYNFGNLRAPAWVQAYTYGASPCQDRNRFTEAWA
jgi:hypothetical protein